MRICRSSKVILWKDEDKRAERLLYRKGRVRTTLTIEQKVGIIRATAHVDARTVAYTERREALGLNRTEGFTRILMII